MGKLKTWLSVREVKLEEVIVDAETHQAQCLIAAGADCVFDNTNPKNAIVYVPLAIGYLERSRGTQ